MGFHNILIWPKSNDYVTYDNHSPFFNANYHIYTSDTSIVSNILVPATGISDHFPVCCTLSVKTVKPVLNVHSSIVYRCFKQFDERAFLMDLHVIPFENVYHFSYPNVALSHWIDLFLDVINKHAALKKKKNKTKNKRGWNTKPFHNGWTLI